MSEAQAKSWSLIVCLASPAPEEHSCRQVKTPSKQSLELYGWSEQDYLAWQGQLSAIEGTRLVCYQQRLWRQQVPVLPW